MLEIERFSKEMLHEVMRELLYSLNYAWFEIEEWLRQKYPAAMMSDEFQKLYERFGAYEARRLSRFVDSATTGIDALMELVKLSHWFAFEDMEIKKQSGICFTMRTMGCTTQKAAKKRGLPYYDCGTTGLLTRIGFFKELNPQVKVERVFTPPDPGPKGTLQEVSCEWLVSIDQG